MQNITSRPNSDKVICGVLEDDCRLPGEESSEKEREITSLSLLERDYRPCRGGKLFTCQLFGTHEREAFSGSLEVHMQPLQKIMSHSKSPR